MKCESLALVMALGLVAAAPVSLPKKLRVREVPQEHSHNIILDGVRVNLNLNNPDKILDPVFGLLGNAAASQGQGDITDTDCLQQATADQAFTNAKAAGNITGMSDALLYRALERNTGKVGLASVPCTAIKAVNPEIAAIQQHQDPASENAAAINKQIVLTLAQQLASIGANPQDALRTGTFAPGDVNDPTGAGNTCDVEDDEPGCIFTQNLLVEDATPDEIDAAVAGISAGSATSSDDTGSADNAASATEASSANTCSDAPTVTATITVDAPAATTAAATSSSTSTAVAAGDNVQTFTGDIGGAAPPVTESSGARPFAVNGSTFVNKAAALERSCDIQNNNCANAVNSGQLAGKTVADCNTQQQQCLAAASA
ncbi:hypothetical protein F5884DRAFT_858406 [Xylogone sp. PMI_703]|nr:hypothetical protein F5884DRAFT_858406 [Xylogone sp. PMI_703]